MSDSAPKRTRNRPTRAEREQIDAACDELLATRTSKRVIKEVLLRSFGLHWRAAERAISQARERLLIESGKSEEECRGEALAAYVAIYRSPEASPREKILANDGICRLLGLNRPQCVRVTNDSDATMARLSGVRRALVQDAQSAELLLQLSERASGLFGPVESPSTQIERNYETTPGDGTPRRRHGPDGRF
jgi:hypothetical protein